MIVMDDDGAKIHPLRSGGFKSIIQLTQRSTSKQDCFKNRRHKELPSTEIKSKNNTLINTKHK